MAGIKKSEIMIPEEVLMRLLDLAVVNTKKPREVDAVFDYLHKSLKDKNPELARKIKGMIDSVTTSVIDY